MPLSKSDTITRPHAVQFFDEVKAIADAIDDLGVVVDSVAANTDDLQTILANAPTLASRVDAILTAGYGDGIVARRADRLQEGTWVPPSSLHDDTVRQRPDGHLFNTITNGIRTMPAYGPQIPERDRWAVVAYVRALQRSQRARVEDRIRAAKATGLANLPFDLWRRNSVWLELVLAAQDLTVWTQALVLDGGLATAEPKTLRYRLLHVAARVVRHARRVVLRLQRS